jgi:hypothetical protein
MPHSILVPGAFAVVGGLLIAGWQLITLSRRPPRLRAGAGAHRHAKVRAQTLNERYTAWHTLRAGVFASCCGAAGLANGQHAAGSCWVLLAGSAVAVLIWDRVSWLRYCRKPDA